jgi:hypothetical protein
MKKVLLAAVILCSAFITRAQINDANAEVRTVTSFHAIDVSSSFDVYLNQSETEALAVSANETKFRDRIKSEVRDGVLHIWYDNAGKWNTGNKKLKAYISFKQLDKIISSGACDLLITGTLKSESLTIKQSGASDLKGKLEVDRLMVDLNGASDMTVSGTVTKLDVDASGASDFKGFDLVTELCNVKATGASDIKITVNKEISAEATGASDIRYKGNGVIRDLKSSGASSVSKG